METLTRMAMDAYNDCLLKRSPAHSWPARSLTHLAVDSFIGHDMHIRKHRTDSEFISFTPTGNNLHHSDPVYYAEMVSCIGEVELDRLKDKLQQCIVYCIQITRS